MLSADSKNFGDVRGAMCAFKYNLDFLFQKTPINPYHPPPHIKRFKNEPMGEVNEDVHP